MNTVRSSHAALDITSRTKKAAKIVAVLKKFVNLSQCHILDIGTGSGHIIAEISKYCEKATSVNLSDERIIKEGYDFQLIQDEHLPFGDEAFDAVISNHVIEHTPNQRQHLSEIHRVLKKGGILYLATPSKYAFMEPHFKLPLLSWFPRGIGSAYLRLFKKRDWDVYTLSYKQLLPLASEFFKVEDMTIKIIKNPKSFSLDMFIGLQDFLKIIPRGIWQLFRNFIPTYILILRKS